MRKSLLLSICFISTLIHGGQIDENVLTKVRTVNAAVHTTYQSSLAATPAAPQKITLILFANSVNDMMQIEAKLKRLSDVNYQRLGFMPAFLVSLSADENLLNEISQYAGVARVSLDIHGQEENYLSAQSILLIPSEGQPQLSNWYDNGYSGQEQTVGLLDSGLAAEHPSLKDKTINIRKEPGSHYDQYLNGVRTAHGTGVACIYAGGAGESPFENEKGIAHETPTIELGLAGDLDSEASNELGLFLTYTSLDWLLNRAPKKPDLINYSFGNGDAACKTCPDWSGMAKVIDFVINHEHILWVKSAGNQGWYPPSDKAPYYSTLTIPADNYNGLTVANMNHVLANFPDGTPNRLFHQITNSSSRGPTLLGRKKPDIAAPGNQTRTCAPDPSVYDYIHYTNAMDYRNGYRLMGGTSSAAPHVGASALILRSAGIQDPMAIKALLINSADAWTDGGVPINDPELPEPAHHALQGSHWDRSYGWGYLNMDTAFKEKDNLIYGKLTVNEPTQSYEIHLGVGGKVTLVHERRVGHTSDGREWQLTPLHLEIYDKETHELIASDNSDIDSVHQVSNCHRAENETACSAEDMDRNIIITVTNATPSLIDGSPEEPFVISYSNTP